MEHLIAFFIGATIIAIPALIVWFALCTEETINIITFQYFYEDCIAAITTIAIWYFLLCPIILAMLLIINNY